MMPPSSSSVRETDLHRQLRDWNAVEPITVLGAAAGKTEWYRGAYAIVDAAVGKDIAGGRFAHTPAMEWWRARLRAEREALYEWVVMMTCDGACSLPLHERQERLADALDAYEVLGVPLGEARPPELGLRST